MLQSARLGRGHRPPYVGYFRPQYLQLPAEGLPSMALPDTAYACRRTPEPAVVQLSLSPTVEMSARTTRLSWDPLSSLPPGRCARTSTPAFYGIAGSTPQFTLVLMQRVTNACMVAGSQALNTSMWAV